MARWPFVRRGMAAGVAAPAAAVGSTDGPDPDGGTSGEIAIQRGKCPPIGSGGMRGALGRKIEPELKARRHQMRSAGHWFGQHEAGRFLADATDITNEAAEAFIAASITAREPSLRSIGGDDDDVREWQAACRKAFVSRIAAYREREE